MTTIHHYRREENTLMHASNNPIRNMTSNQRRIDVNATLFLGCVSGGKGAGEPCYSLSEKFNA